MVSIVKTGSNGEPRPGSGEPFRTSDVCTIISLSIIKSGFKYSENIGYLALRIKAKHRSNCFRAVDGKLYIVVCNILNFEVGCR